MASYDTTRELLLRPGAQSAVSTSENLITIDAVRALLHLGPRHVARVGFDDVVPAPRLVGHRSGELPPARVSPS